VFRPTSGGDFRVTLRSELPKIHAIFGNSPIPSNQGDHSETRKVSRSTA
jgi:hypothetical protein